MKIIESSKIKEKAYVEKLESGMQVIIIPKQHTTKKEILYICMQQIPLLSSHI